MTTQKADAYDIFGSYDSEFLLNGCGLFALSNGDAVECVVLDRELAFTQTDYEYVDAFPGQGGARVCAFKCKGQSEHMDGITNVWTSNF